VRALLSERFAPVTTTIGFLELPFDEVVEGLAAWRRRLNGQITVTPIAGGFPASIHALEPLAVGTGPRELLISTHSGWTAYVSNDALGTDEGATAYLSRTLGCTGVIVSARPETPGVPGKIPPRHKWLHWTLFGPLQTQFINYVRTVAVTYDNGWHFHAIGTEQDYEEVERYSLRTRRDRFTSEMLERYCQAIGIDVFNADWYGPRCTMVERQITYANKLTFLTLEETQHRYGIVPGEVDAAPD
jgi:hypothetical protein